MKIPFNKPYFSGNELEYIKKTFNLGKISGDGYFTQKCHEFFENRYAFKKVLLTTSCTDALEMSAILLDIQPGDEVIAPSYTFVSTVNPFVLRGAKIVFVDSNPLNPNIDVDKIEALINKKTKVIMAVHYAGIACDMNRITQLSTKYNLFVVEDAAQAIDSYYNDKPLGSIGNIGAVSFHETKNISSGEGGMIIINDEKFIKRAEIIREKGTNRTAFFRGEVDKYGWVDVGSSFLPSDINAALLYAQLEKIDEIQKRRKQIWAQYFNALKLIEEKGDIKLPFIPANATNNAHIFYIVVRKHEELMLLIKKLKENEILAVFHYLSLHQSIFFKGKHDGRELPMADHYSDCLLRLPLFFELEDEMIKKIINIIKNVYI